MIDLFDISFARAARDWYLGALWMSPHHAAFDDSMSVSQLPEAVDVAQRGAGLILPAMEHIE